MTIEEKEQKRLKKNVYMKIYAKQNREKLSAYRKQHYLENKEYVLSQNARYREINKEKIVSQKKQDYIANKSIINNKHKEYYQKNKDAIKQCYRKYAKENVEKIRKYQNEYKRNRRKNDPLYKMVRNLRGRIQKALKSQGATKDSTTLELFGASKEFVWKHLESQFREGMTRKNNSPKGWHIDHIKPMISFDLSDPEQLKECCHYTNLQPLWWWENLEKSDKYEKILEKVTD
jgi:hypothetical protein